MTNRFIAIFILLVSFMQQSIAQSVGMTAGAGLGNFFDLRYNEQNVYTAEYTSGPGLQFGAFYQLKNDPVRFELQYANQRAGLESVQYAGHGSGGNYYTNLNFLFQQLNFGAMFTIALGGKEKRVSANLLAGALLSYTLRTYSEGNMSQTYIDSNGVAHTVYGVKHWNRNDYNSKDLSAISGGVLLGLELNFKLNEKMALILQNRYNLYVTNFVRMPFVLPARFWNANLAVGVKYSL